MKSRGCHEWDERSSRCQADRESGIRSLAIPVLAGLTKQGGVPTQDGTVNESNSRPISVAGWQFYYTKTRVDTQSISGWVTVECSVYLMPDGSLVAEADNPVRPFWDKDVARAIIEMLAKYDLRWLDDAPDLTEYFNLRKDSYDDWPQG